MIVHELKTIQPFFERVRLGEKTSELRLNDRDFQSGDTLILKEFDTRTGLYGGNIRVLVTHVLLNYQGLKKGYCMLSFKIL